MILDKKSYKSDRLVNLYRAAFYLAKGNSKLALEFLKKAKIKLRINRLTTTDQQLFWAEKILDKFHLLKRTAG